LVFVFNFELLTKIQIISISIKTTGQVLIKEVVEIFIRLQDETKQNFCMYYKYEELLVSLILIKDILKTK